MPSYPKRPSGASTACAVERVLSNIMTADATVQKLRAQLADTERRDKLSAAAKNPRSRKRRTADAV
jgi:hypothetical protein